MVPPGRRRFATLFAKANELARKPDLSDFSWADDAAYSWDMGTSSSRDSDEDEAGDAGSRGEFMVEQCTAVRNDLPAGPRHGNAVDNSVDDA